MPITLICEKSSYKLCKPRLKTVDVMYKIYLFGVSRLLDTKILPRFSYFSIKEQVAKIFVYFKGRNFRGAQSKKFAKFQR